MDILLLHVSRFALEGNIPWYPIHVHVPGNDPSHHAVSEDVEESGFASAGNTLGRNAVLASSLIARTNSTQEETCHQRGQGSGFDPAIDVVQDPPGLAFLLNIITHILPMEDLAFTGRNMRPCSRIRRTCQRHRRNLGLEGLLIVGLGHSARNSFIVKVAASEEQYLAFALSHTEQFSRGEVSGCKENPESYQYTHVPSGPSVLCRLGGSGVMTYRHLLA
jgi:hypothetical protein